MRPTDIWTESNFLQILLKISLIVLAGRTVEKTVCLFLKFAIELSGETQCETIRIKVSFVHSSFRSLSLAQSS